MAQPQYDDATVRAMTNEELADELRQWATARKVVSVARFAQGKEPLDYKLLEEAADRLLDRSKLEE